ncbi:MAG: hypothetical protein RMM51_00735 [Verrucomicrobiae bacterium]|nr:hypothetical protein [Verrucomicrobiae bacterium]
MSTVQLQLAQAHFIRRDRLELADVFIRILLSLHHTPAGEIRNHP